ncbi:hypothetical protein QQ045_016937 [Rhodiola kirilowii]
MLPVPQHAAKPSHSYSCQYMEVPYMMERETLHGGDINPQQKRGDRNPQQKRGVDFQNLREELYSIFIDNIPVGKDVSWVRALFNQDGQSVDVFISARGRRASNSRFGFVRYMTLGEAKATIRRWNGANVGKAKLLVTLADNGAKPRAGGRFERWRSELPVRDRCKGGAVSVWRPKIVGADLGTQARNEVNEASKGQNYKKKGESISRIRRLVAQIISGRF